MQQITDLSESEARQHFMSSHSYSSLPIPSYFDFTNLLAQTSKVMEELGGTRDNYKTGYPDIRDIQDANYLFLANKDGGSSWRPFSLINPVLYIELVNLITDKDNWSFIKNKFLEFQQIPNITCCSLPTFEKNAKQTTEASITDYWSKFEQESIAQSIEYQCIAITDITNCYGSIYTHSLSWALHGKEAGKEDRKQHPPRLLGGKIDQILQDMQHGQTNGIPQGNVISDIIAELILGYADSLLSSALQDDNEQDDNETVGRPENWYKIIRYRDDYRIFTHSTEDARTVLLNLTKTLQSVNMQLNQTKTHISSGIISSSVKKDKAHLIRLGFPRSFPVGGHQKRLFAIRQFAIEHPNSGGLERLVSNFRKRIESTEVHSGKFSDVAVLISLVFDIMIRNPRSYAQCMSLLSVLFDFLEPKEVEGQVDMIQNRMKEIPNTGYFDLWLQRISHPRRLFLPYQEKLCQHINGRSPKLKYRLWDTSWVDKKLQRVIKCTPIVDSDALKSLSPVVPIEETTLFIEPYRTHIFSASKVQEK